jgi:hypothetical protein
MVLTGFGLRETLNRKMDAAGILSLSHVGITYKMASYLMQSRTDNIVKKYRFSFQYFEKYCVTHGLTQPISVALYLTFLIDQEKSNNIILSVFEGLNVFIL